MIERRPVQVWDEDIGNWVTTSKSYRVIIDNVGVDVVTVWKTPGFYVYKDRPNRKSYHYVFNIGGSARKELTFQVLHKLAHDEKIMFPQFVGEEGEIIHLSDIDDWNEPVYVSQIIVDVLDACKIGDDERFAITLAQYIEELRTSNVEEEKNGEN